MVRVWNVKKEKRKKKEPLIFNTIFKLKNSININVNININIQIYSFTIHNFFIILGVALHNCAVRKAL